MNNLERLKEFEIMSCPNSKLEQYFTPPNIALKFLNKLDLKNKVVADLGCGTGILGLTAILLGAKKVYFIDIDENTINIAKRNFASLQKTNETLPSALFVNKDISLIKKSVFSDIDICLLNPPFGTNEDNKKIDVVFLKKAMKLSNKIISMHKTASKTFIKSIIQENNFELSYEEDFLFPLAKQYAHHSNDVVDVTVTAFIAKKQE